MGRWAGSRRRCALLRLGAIGSALLAVASLATDAQADAPAPRARVGFSRIVVNVESGDTLGFGSVDLRSLLLQRMRARGLEAVGAENTVFDKDEGRLAEYVIGGTLTELACKGHGPSLSCRAGVQWQVLDVVRDQVVYTLTSRAAVVDEEVETNVEMVRRLAARNLDSLISRAGFRRALAPHEPAGDEPVAFPEATLGRCPAGKPVASGAEDLLRKVVVIKEGGGFGSGFFVSPEGLVLTAAHVVVGNDKVTLRLRDSTEVAAVPVRVARREDVALLRLAQPGPMRPCVPIGRDVPASGTEVYAVGAPAKIDLAFSITRGIVSGVPVFDGRRHIQTDASVSPGNSGGPLADSTGAAVGVVQSKVVASRVEGVAFAVPIGDALRVLGLVVAGETSPSLFTDAPAVAGPPPAARLDDTPDAVQSLDPEGDWRRSSAREMAETGDARASAEPTEGQTDHAAASRALSLRLAGLAVAGGGLVVAGLTYYVAQAPAVTESEFNSLQTWNTIGWVAVGVGGAATLVSFLLPTGGKQAKKSALRLGVGGAAWQGTF